jgi:hypothetical protein
MPTLTQIQSYVKYRKAKLGDNANIEDLKAYAETLQYHEDIEENEMFVFGEDYGDGSDKAHFHIGFTSVKMLKKIDEFRNRGC